MKEKRKTFVLGFLAAVVVLVLAVPVLAAGNLQTWNDVLVGGITIKLNGETIDPKDVNGNPVDPVIYDGTTYLPVRAIASALGLEVEWDGSTRTVVLISKSEEESLIISPQPTEAPQATEEPIPTEIPQSEEDLLPISLENLDGIWYRNSDGVEAEYTFRENEYIFASKQKSGYAYAWGSYYVENNTIQRDGLIIYLIVAEDGATSLYANADDFRMEKPTVSQSEFSFSHENVVYEHQKTEEAVLIDYVYEKINDRANNIITSDLSGSWYGEITNAEGLRLKFGFSFKDDGTFCGANDLDDLLMYQSGTYYVKDGKLYLLSKMQFVDSEGMVSSGNEEEVFSINLYTYYSFDLMYNNTTIRYTRTPDEQFLTSVKNRFEKEIEQDSSDYKDYAVSDFHRIRRNYSQATPSFAYVTVYTNLDGELCVLTDVWYKIISDYHEITLHNITSGRTIEDPEEYYDGIINRKYGQEKIHYMDLKIELLEHYTNELTEGLYVSAEELG